jgi:hypothetical protein
MVNTAAPSLAPYAFPAVIEKPSNDDGFGHGLLQFSGATCENHILAF